MISIKNCTPEDAPLIGKAIMTALHEEYNISEPWSRLFTVLASLDDSQYSYRNSLKAVNENGDIAGIIVAYDGGDLSRLRRRFFEQYKREFGREIGPVADETCSGEWYLDSLAVFPGFRGQGIGKLLLNAAINKAPEGLRPGLLCSKSNPKAAGLYSGLGFKVDGERPFLGELMDHYCLV